MCKRKKKMKEFGGRPAGHKKAAWLLVACLLALLVAGALQSCRRKDGLTPEKKTAVVKIGFDSFKPYSSVDENGNYVGIDIELATEAFRRMGYRAEFTTIDWEQKTKLVDNGEIDCIWDCFSMDGRENDYQWAGPYLVSRQVIAVSAQSSIERMSDLAGKTIAVQSTGKPEAIFLSGDENVPAFRNIISLADRGVQYAMLDCGYVDAVAAHEEAIRQYMKDYGANFRILDEPLLTTGIGVAFSKNDTRGLAAQLTEVFAQMREDGSMEQLVGKYLEVPAHSLEVEQLEQ